MCCAATCGHSTRPCITSIVSSCRASLVPMARLLVVLALLLAGCSSTSPPTVTLPSPSSSAAPTAEASATSASLPPPTGVSSPVTIKVVKSGGFIGMHTEIVVDPSGRWTRDGGSGRLSPPLAAELQRLAADPQLAIEAQHSPAPNQCNDDFRYTVTAGKHKVSYSDCTADSFMPPAAVRIADFVLSHTVP